MYSFCLVNPEYKLGGGCLSLATSLALLIQVRVLIYLQLPFQACHPLMNERMVDPEAMLPIYLLVIGSEGSGHHALETIWKSLSAAYNVVLITFDAHFHGIRGVVNASRAYHHSSASFEYQRFLVKEFLRLPRVRGKQIIIDARNSFPAGFGVGSLAHPDIRHLAMMDGDLFDFRALVIKRDETASIVSAVNRFYDTDMSRPNNFKSFRFQNRLTQTLLTLMNNHIALLPCGKTLFLTYETLTSDKEKIVHPLATLLSVTEDHIRVSLGNVHVNHGIAASTKLSTDDVAQIRFFFEQQKMLWPLLHESGPLGAQELRLPSTKLIPRSTRPNIPVIPPRCFPYPAIYEAMLSLV